MNLAIARSWQAHRSELTASKMNRAPTDFPNRVSTKSRWQNFSPNRILVKKRKKNISFFPLSTHQPRVPTTKNCHITSYHYHIQNPPKKNIVSPVFVCCYFGESLSPCALTTSPSTSPQRRSLIYGDRHPEQGLFHIDRSSMRNFVRGSWIRLTFRLVCGRGVIWR